MTIVNSRIGKKSHVKNHNSYWCNNTLVRGVVKVERFGFGT